MKSSNFPGAADKAAPSAPAPSAPPFVVGFVGFSGAGKTTLATEVVRVLVNRGLRVAALKDAHHGIDLDRPGKDTWRYREAGASEVMLRTAERYAVLVETRSAVPIEALLSRVLPGTDVVVVEGFKHEGNFPKIEILRRGFSEQSGREPLFAVDPLIVAVATDAPELARGLPVLDVNDPQAVADYVLALRQGRGVLRF